MSDEIEMTCVAIERGRDKIVHRLSCHHTRSLYRAGGNPSHELGEAKDLLEDVMAYACRVCKPDKDR